MNQESLIVNGIVFPNYKEAQIALKEMKNIEIIRERTSLHDKKACFDLYTKLIERNMFKTVIGYSFLCELRYILISEFHYLESDLPYAVLPKQLEYETVNNRNQTFLESRLEHAMLVQKRLKIIIFALVFMVLTMFVIAAINPNAGYINAENKVLDKYATWQEQLEQREKALKEKEAELYGNPAE